jgi:hypothetical protein
MKYGPRITRRTNRSVFPWKIHPVWRGIGCILAILIPALSFYLAAYLIANMQGTELMIETPPVEVPFIGEVENFWLIFGLGMLISPGIFIVLGILGAMIYSAAGGPENERQARVGHRKPRDYDQEDKS